MFDEKFKVITELSYGWSGDRKFLVCDKQDERYFLRKSHISRQKHALLEFELVSRLFALGMNVPEPIASGLSEDLMTYDRIYRWIDGTMLQDVLPDLERERQIQLGLDAGHMLRTLHSIDVYGYSFDWSNHCLDKIQSKLDAYKTSGIRLDQETMFMHWISDSILLLRDRPITYQHGD